jgi:error-prone DNA polymerase
VEEFLSQDRGGTLACGCPGPHATPMEQGAWIARVFAGRAWIAVELLRDGHDREHLDRSRRLGARHGLPLCAAGDVHMHVRERRALQDALTAVRHGVSVAQAGTRLFPNGERHLRERERLAKLYPAELLAETVKIAALADFSLDELRYEYPRELVPAGETPASHLRKLAQAGACKRWPAGIPAAMQAKIDYELALIGDLKYESYFLTVHDIVSEARRPQHPLPGARLGRELGGVLLPRRHRGGSSRGELLMERFISRERNEPPDIDIDFEHERREEVIQYIYRKYGRDRTALTATVISYRPRSALRDMAKAIGLDAVQAERLAGAMQWWDTAVDGERIREAGFEPDNPQVLHLMYLVAQLLGFPRHLSQHVGGFVISQGLLEELVPIENAAMEDRTVIEWDKDDLDDLGLLKVDVLGLGMLSALRRGLEYVGRLPPQVLHARGRAEGRRARLRDDLARRHHRRVPGGIARADVDAAAACARRSSTTWSSRWPSCGPVPIQGGMVHPYLRRRQGLDPVTYPATPVKGCCHARWACPSSRSRSCSSPSSRPASRPARPTSCAGAWRRGNAAAGSAISRSGSSRA